MQQTSNASIKIVRLQSGEDIMATCLEDEEHGTILLDNPMHIIFKRLPTSGQTVMMMMPWLPIEVIKENTAIIYDSDVLTIIEPREDLIDYYGGAVVEAQLRMEKKTPLLDMEDDDDEEEYDEDEIDAEQLFELMKDKDKGSIH